MEKIAIIIATYNGKHFLEKSIPSVLKSIYTNFELIICDDCSTDGSYEYIENIQATDSRIKLLKNDTNKGASASRNNAVTRATGSILIFLDNDTEVEPDWLNSLLEILNSDASIGAVQSTLVQYDKRDAIQLTGVHLIPYTCWAVPINYNNQVATRDMKSQPIVALSAALAVRKHVFETIGGFDEILAVYTEDLEFSLRIWIAGYRIVSAPKSIVYHWTKKMSDRKEMNTTRESLYFHLTKNAIRTICKNYEFFNALYYLSCAVVIVCVRALIRLWYKDTTAIKGTVAGLIYSIKIVGDTLDQREKVQNQIRKQSDLKIFEQIATKESLLSIYKKYFS